MQDKNTLINSMNNLINHIAVSQKNQEEMFDNLSSKDFDKIVANLEDPLLRLRMTTVYLLSQLLYNNLELKRRFCVMTNTPPCADSHMILNSNFGKLIEKHRSRARDIFNLLRSFNAGHHGSTLSKQPLFWFINPRRQVLSVEYMHRDDIISICSALAANNYIQLNFDPLECIFGISLQPSSVVTGRGQPKVQTSQSATTDATKPKSNTKNGDNLSQGGPKGVHYKPVSLQIGTRKPVGNAEFLKQNNRQEPTKKTTHIQSSNRSYIESSNKVQISNNFNFNNSVHLGYAQRPSLGHKENQHRLSTSFNQKDKYIYRMSLPVNDIRQNKNNATYQTQENLTIEIPRRDSFSHQQDPIHGIKIFTPRHTIKPGAQKIPLSSQEPKTDRPYLERESYQVERAHYNRPITSTGPVVNQNKLKTIHLGRGKGWETSREHKKIAHIESN